MLDPQSTFSDIDVARRGHEEFSRTVPSRAGFLLILFLFMLATTPLTAFSYHERTHSGLLASVGDFFSSLYCFFATCEEPSPPAEITEDTESDPEPVKDNTEPPLGVNSDEEAEEEVLLRAMPPHTHPTLTLPNYLSLPSFNTLTSRLDILEAQGSTAGVTRRPFDLEALTSEFVTYDHLIRQVDSTYDSISDRFSAVAESFTTTFLTATDLVVTDDVDIAGSLTVDGTITGAFTGSFAPTGNVDMATHRLYNVGTGASGFLADGSLDLNGDLDVSGTTTLTGAVTASTSLTTPLLTSTDALVLTPAAGSNLNVNLSTTGDLAVNTDDLFVDTSKGNVGIGDTTPDFTLDVAGKIGVDGTQMVYLPDQAMFAGSLVIGDGGGSLTDSGGSADGERNTFVGIRAGLLNTTGRFNTAVGYQALRDNGTGQLNTAVGEEALANNTTGSFNTALGEDALLFNTTGISNTALGVDSLTFNSTGTENTAVGMSTLQFNTTGSENTALGRSSLFYNTTGSQNAVLGRSAGVGTDGMAVTGNVIFGYQAGLAINTGADHNTLLGYQAGDNVTTGARNIVIGYNTDAPVATASDQLNIGNTIYGDLASGEIGIGDSTPDFPLDVAGRVGVNGMQVVYLPDQTTFTGSFVIGNGGGNLTGPGGGSFDGRYNTFVGINSGLSNTTGYHNTALGNLTLNANTTGRENTAIGSDTLRSNTTGVENTAIGSGALRFNTTGGRNTAVGEGSLFRNTTGLGNSALGYWALTNNTSGFSNVAIGESASESNTLGSYNTAIGREALKFNTGGYNNTALGKSAGEGTSGMSVTGNTLLGWEAGDSIDTGADYNVALGYTAGDNITTGARNIVIGYNTDAPVATASDQLNIGNTIYGDLALNEVGIGVTDPLTTLHVAGTIRQTNAVSCAVETDANGDIICAPSDKTLKIVADRNLDNALDKVNSLNPVYFTWKDTDRFGTQRELGFLAQDVQAILPEAVTHTGDYLSLNYGRLTALNAAAIQELDVKVETLTESLEGGSLVNLFKDALLALGIEAQDGALTLRELIADTVRARRVETEELCLDGVCVTKDKLMQLLNDTGTDPDIDKESVGENKQDEDQDADQDQTEDKEIGEIGESDADTDVSEGDTKPPEITLNGEAEVAMTQGDAYEDAGVTAEDAVDGDLTSTIITDNPVDTTIPGTYIVTYTVVDSAGNTAKATRTVTVVAPSSAESEASTESEESPADDPDLTEEPEVSAELGGGQTDTGEGGTPE